jgi:hypothetical protein
VARMRTKRIAHWVLVGKHEGRENLQDTDGDGSIILKWLIKTRSDSACLEEGQVAGCCEDGYVFFLLHRMSSWGTSSLSKSNLLQGVDTHFFNWFVS